MRRRHKILATTFLTTALITGGTTWRVAEHLYWNPVNLSAYEEDALRALPRQNMARYLAERVSGRISETSTGPVSGALIMSEVLGAFADLEAAHGTLAAVIGSAAVYDVWDEEGAQLWLAGFEGLDTDSNPLGSLEQKARADVAQRVASTRRLKDMDLATPAPSSDPDRPVWQAEPGTKDGDALAGGYPLSRDLDLPVVPPPPAPESALDRLDLVQVRLAARLKTDSQIANSIWWQGSGGFDKNSSSGGLNPPDLWQSIAFAHAGQSMESGDYARLSADLAHVLRDAMISAWRVKYRDWTARPNHRAGKIGNAIGNPPFPGYVSGHATAAAAAAEFLVQRDPDNASRYRRLARDSANSRLWGGVHVDSDNEAGIALGRHVAAGHLGLDVDPNWRTTQIPELDGWLLERLENGLDLFDDVSDSVRARLFGDLAFREQDHGIPKTTTTRSPVEVHDTFAGSLALADLDGDGLKEALVTGRNEARLYRNVSRPGEIAFDLVWEAYPDAISGAFFTHDTEGVVDGIMAFGQNAPQFFARADSLAFSAVPQVATGFPHEDFASQGVVLFDSDGDGDQDVLLTESSFPFSAPSSESFNRARRPNILLERKGEGFVFDRFIDSPSGSTLAGGYMDINEDGVPDRGLVTDFGRIQVVDGATGKDLSLAPEIDKVIFGMSFTPIEVAGRPAFHVSNIHDGEDWPYGEPPRPDELKDDIIVAWDAQAGHLVDIAEGRLHYGIGEWGWGSAAGDLNGDGREDLVATNGFTLNTPYGCDMRIFLQGADGSFEGQDGVIDFELGDSSPRAVALDDLDGDGDLDVLLNASQQVRLWENTSQIEGRAARVMASPTRGYLTQVIDPKTMPKVALPPLLRERQPEDFEEE